MRAPLDSNGKTLVVGIYFNSSRNFHSATNAARFCLGGGFPVASKLYRSAMQLAPNLAEDRVGARRLNMSDEFQIAGIWCVVRL
jgi:hypothetical protein